MEGSRGSLAPHAWDVEPEPADQDGDPGMAPEEDEPGAPSSPVNPALARALIRDGHARFGERFRPARYLVEALEGSEDPEDQELARAVKAPAVQGRILAKLRIHFPDIEHWAISLVSHVASCKLFEWPITFRGLAHAADLKEWELSDRLNHASAAAAAFIAYYVPPDVTRDVLQLEITASVRDVMISLHQAMKEMPLPGRGPWHGGRVPRAIKAQGRERTVIQLNPAAVRRN